MNFQIDLFGKISEDQLWEWEKRIYDLQYQIEKSRKVKIPWNNKQGWRWKRTDDQILVWELSLIAQRNISERMRNITMKWHKAALDKFYENRKDLFFKLNELKKRLNKYSK